MKKSIKIVIVVFLFAILPLAMEASSKENVRSFFIEPAYDLYERNQTEVKLEKTAEYIYFYVDNDWWSELSREKQESYDTILTDLDTEFGNSIYTEVSNRFGNKPEHSVNPDSRIYVLFHPMSRNAGGYFRSGDQYSRYQYSKSNERNILYLSSSVIEDKALPGYLAHEYMHLVTFNEKNRKYGINEEIWLNELRSEVVPTLLGYDDEYRESNLRLRVQGFLRDPDISLTEWTEQAADYGVINLFAQYLTGHYGEEIISESLNSEFVGIYSIDYALAKHEKTFAEVFTDWTVATYLNDCSLGEEYCYKNENLKDVRVSPTNYFLPTKNEEPFATEYRTKNWAGNWHRIVGGSGTLYLEFRGEGRFVVPYVLCEKKDEECSVYYLETDDENKGELIIEEFNSKYEALTIIPSLQEKFEGFNGPEQTKSFYWQARIIDDEDVIKKEEEREIYLQEVKERLAALRKEILNLYNLLGINLPGEKVVKIEENLYFGMKDSEKVRNLQRFLKNQGSDVYPEGLVTGNFYELTRNAVMRFQEKHKEEVLLPAGSLLATGYVGKFTRKYINSLING